MNNKKRMAVFVRNGHFFTHWISSQNRQIYRGNGRIRISNTSLKKEEESENRKEGILVRNKLCKNEEKRGRES